MLNLIITELFFLVDRRIACMDEDLGTDAGLIAAEMDEEGYTARRSSPQQSNLAGEEHESGSDSDSDDLGLRITAVSSRFIFQILSSHMQNIPLNITAKVAKRARPLSTTATSNTEDETSVNLAMHEQAANLVSCS